jgi:ABC-type multidrug transport system fused ATPase/permease subunit
VRNADRILILSAGRIVEHGSHSELIAQGGTYAKLFKANHASFDDGQV